MTCPLFVVAAGLREPPPCVYARITVGPSGAHLLAQSGEIGSQYRWCHDNMLHGCHLDQRSPVAAISTNQMSLPTGLTRAAGAWLLPARIALKIAAFSSPTTRNATCRLLSITG